MGGRGTFGQTATAPTSEASYPRNLGSERERLVFERFAKTPHPMVGHCRLHDEDHVHHVRHLPQLHLQGVHFKAKHQHESQLPWLLKLLSREGCVIACRVRGKGRGTTGKVWRYRRRKSGQRSQRCDWIVREGRVERGLPWPVFFWSRPSKNIFLFCSRSSQEEQGGKE